MSKRMESLLGAAARLSCVDEEVLRGVYAYLRTEIGNPYLAIEYLLIKSLDSRLARMAIKEGDSVLNIGCGYPINEIILHSWGVKKIVGVDLSDSTIRKGRRWLQGLGIETELYQGDALAPDFAKESFDVVVSFSAIEHVRGWQNYEKWVDNMSKIARKRIVLTTSNRKNLPLFLLGKLVRMEGFEHFFTPQEIEKLLSDHGLRVTHFDTSALWCMNYLPYLPGRVKYNALTLEVDLLLEKLRERVLKAYGGRMGFLASKEQA